MSKNEQLLLISSPSPNSDIFFSISTPALSPNLPTTPPTLPTPLILPLPFLPPSIPL